MPDVLDYLLSDVIVIGGGIAGCCAAIEAAEYASSVIMVDQGTIGSGLAPKGRESVFAAGTPSASRQDRWQSHYRDTLAYGENLGQGPLVSLLARDALRNAWDLDRYGFSWQRSPEGGFEIASLDGHSVPRTLRPVDGTKQSLEDVLAARAREHIGLRILEKLTITTLLQQAGEIVGAVGLYPETGQLIVLTAGCVIMAGGGMSGLYDFGSRRGASVATAYRLGAEIIAPEMQLVGNAGATDVTCYSLGGLRIDDRCRTSVPGLYAAGEAAGGVHGARLLPGNKLTDAAVFGANAGRFAALERRRIPRIKEEGVKEEIMRLQRFAKRLSRGKQGGNSLKDFAGQLNAMMQKGAGSSRSASGLEAIACWLEDLGQSWLDEIDAPESEVSGAHLQDVLEVDALLELAQVVVKAATMREESRGVHQRTDFPKPDPKWASNIITRKDDDKHVFTCVSVEADPLPIEVARP